MDEQKKQRFSDVIGGLVSGVAYARSVADMEAMRIAYYYLQHELLKGMPVPRLRIQRVSISLPIIVSEVIPGAPAVRNPAVDVAQCATEALQKAMDATLNEFADSEALRTQQKAILSKQEEELLIRFEKIVQYAQKHGVIERFRTQLLEDIEQAHLDLNLSEGASPSDVSLRGVAGQVAEKVARQILTENISLYVHQKAMQKAFYFSVDDLKNPSAFVARLKQPHEDDAVSEYIRGKLSDTIRQFLTKWTGSEPLSEEIIKVLVHDLSKLIKQELIYEEARFAKVTLQPQTRKLLEQKGRSENDLVRLNRLLMEDAYPRELSTQAFDPERGKKAIAELMDHELTAKLIRVVRSAAEENAARTGTIPPDFYVSVNTGEIKNAGGGPDTVTRLEMVLREEGLEWMTEEQEGKKTSKLMPE